MADAPGPSDEGVAFVAKQFEDELQHLLLLDQTALLLRNLELGKPGLHVDLFGLGFGKRDSSTVDLPVAFFLASRRLFGKWLRFFANMPSAVAGSIFPWLSHFRTTA